jgi:hypothetical protein
MDPFTAALIAQGVAQIGGAIIGGFASRGERQAAEEAQKKALAIIEQLGAGPDLARKIYLDQFQSAGVLTPEIEKAVTSVTSKVSQIKEDPRFKEAQLKALSALQERGQLGYTPEERLEMMQQQRAAEREAGAQRAGILEGLRARGLGESGAGLRAQLQSADELAERQMMLGQQRSAQASQRALQSMVQAGQLGGQIRGQEFDIDRSRAGAEDEMNRFNVANRMTQEQRRVAAENQARQFNLANQQAIMNMNTQAINAERTRQREAEQRMYQNQLAIAQMKSGAASAEAQQAAQRAGTTQQAWTQAGQAIGQGISAYGQYEAGRGLRDAQTGYYNSLAANNAPSASPPATPVSPALGSSSDTVAGQSLSRYGYPGAPAYTPPVIQPVVPMDSNLQKVSPLGVEDYMTQQSQLPNWYR